MGCIPAYGESYSQNEIPNLHITTEFNNIPAMLKALHVDTMILNCAPLSLIEKALSHMSKSSIESVNMGISSNLCSVIRPSNFVLEAQLDNAQKTYDDISPNAWSLKLIKLVHLYCEFI